MSFKILKLSVLLVFVGRAWQHIFWDVPFRNLFFDEHLLKPIIEEFFAVHWNDYASSATVDYFIQKFILTFGIIYVFSAFSTINFNFKNHFYKVTILIGGSGLIILALLLMKVNSYRLIQFLECSLQFSIPFILVYYRKAFLKQHLEKILKLLVALVFMAHGLFAIGYYPVPGHFLGMVMDIFACSEDASRTFLFVAGLMDISVAILIFVPKTTKYALIYAFVWGISTSLARIISGFDIDHFWYSIHLNLFQVVYRLPHGLIPLMLLAMAIEKKAIKNDDLFLK